MFYLYEDQIQIAPFEMTQGEDGISFYIVQD